MSYIEHDFPVEKLNRVALAEGNSKKPVYAMHKWWARRLGSVFRMIILAAFGEDGESAESVWGKFCQGYNLEGKLILDPFMGGGTTLVEALRLGARVIGVDINPVAWFVTKKEIEPVDLHALDAAVAELEEAVGNRIRQYYRTTCPQGHEADVMYYFWVKVAPCSVCGNLVQLFPNYELSRRDHQHVVVCPRCLWVFETPGYHSETVCPECGHGFDPRKGVSRRGVFRCLTCGTDHRIVDVVSTLGHALDMQLHALEGYCQHCGRFFKRVDEGDLALWERAREEFARRRDTLRIPSQAIPTAGRSDPRPVNHGYTHFWHMFNERQLLSLSLLLEHILRISDQNIREFLLLAFSDCLGTNNMFCKYEIDWHKVSPFFGLHAYHPIERPAENNVWGTRYGRGSFMRCVEKLRKGKAYCQRPYERLVDAQGRRRVLFPKNEQIAGMLTSSVEELLHQQNGAYLRCQSSEDLSFIPDGSVDAVITDPPYFDNVQYSELADFFYVWLRLGLRDLYPWFEPELSQRPEEIVQNQKSGKTAELFAEGLRRVFAECHRVLKDDGLMVFTFHHNQRWAWEGMAKLLLDAGFYISASPIVRSEGRSGFHSSSGNIRYDSVLVCRKQPSPMPRSHWPAVKEQIMQDAVTWTQRTLASGMPVNPVDIFTIVMAKGIEWYTRVAAGGGFEEVVPLPEALAELEELVTTVETGPGLEMKLAKEAVPETVRQLSLFVMESQERYQVPKRSAAETL